ncbi:MAG: GNAT family N-acetyltransferase [Thermomicrobiales bacterium]
MDRSVEHIELTMFRSDLQDFSAALLPPGYSVRLYVDGDREHWAEIEMSAGEFNSIEDARVAFDHDFGPDLAEAKRRMLFLEVDGIGPVGTTTAWFGEFRGETIGLIHWVALKSEYHGMGLSIPLLASALSLMSEFDSSAHLHTQTTSWRAIGLYQKFGFTRVDETDDDHRGWAIVDECLSRPR